MIERIATISSKNQITLSAEVRKRLGVGASDKVAFVFTPSGDILVRRPKYTLDTILGSIRALPGESLDLEKEIEEATEEEIRRKQQRQQHR
jgi:bifunctional DNA-binding transcriptional regulator/antitoxin component of YhaV-PrlF toxin-antitoxin module